MICVKGGTSAPCVGAAVGIGILGLSIYNTFFGDSGYDHNTEYSHTGADGSHTDLNTNQQIDSIGANGEIYFHSNYGNYGN